MKFSKQWMMILAAQSLGGLDAHELLRGRRRMQQLNLPDGIWSSRGYGMVVHVVDGQARMLEETQTSCIHNDFLLPFWDANPKIVNGTAILTAAAETINEFVFDRSDTFQAGCQGGSTSIVGDPDYLPNSLEDFDILVQTFREHYAFFEQRGIDWDALTAQHRASLTTESTEEEMWQTFVNLLTPLDDPHVMLFNGVELFRAKDVDLEFYGSQLSKWQSITSSYMVNETLTEWGDGAVFSGKVASEGQAVGYLKIDTMGFEDFSVSTQAVEEAVLSLMDTHTIILDLRFNLGGSDSLSFFIASLFAEERLLVGRKRAINGDGWTQDQEVYIEPFPDASRRYQGNLILLTSGWTVSAAEVFTMAMMQLPKTTLLGRNTIGAFSDSLQKMMPNQWRFSTSNEVYEDASGMSYEITGISPDINPVADFMDESDEENAKDSWLEMAMAIATTSVDEGDPSSNGTAGQTLRWAQMIGACSLFVALV